MSLRLKPDPRVIAYSEYIDLRAGFDKLSMIVREKIRANLVDGALYLFFGRDRRKYKAIYYDGTGALLVARRMEDLEENEITREEYEWLLRRSVVRRAQFGILPVDNRALLPAFLAQREDDTL